MSTRPDEQAFLFDLKRRMLGVVTQAEIARRHGVRPEHVCMVLAGQRRSKRIIRFIEETIRVRTGGVIDDRVEVLSNFSQPVFAQALAVARTALRIRIKTSRELWAHTRRLRLSRDEQRVFVQNYVEARAALVCLSQPIFTR